MRSFDECYAQLPGVGWLSRAEARVLWDNAVNEEGPILEVGCYHGRSTVLLAEFGRPVWAVDPFLNFSTEDPEGKKTKLAFYSNLVDRGIQNVACFEKRVEDWEPLGKVGIAYLDGDHTYRGTVEQINKALACDPDVILIHDVNDSGDGMMVKQAALIRLGAWQERVERIAVWRFR